MNEATTLTTTSDIVTEQDKGRCAQAPGSAFPKAQRTFTLDSCPPTQERTGLLLREVVCAAEYLLQNGAMKIAIFEEPPNDQAHLQPPGGNGGAQNI